MHSTDDPPACTVSPYGELVDPTAALRAGAEDVGFARWRVDRARDLDWAGPAADAYREMLVDAVARAVAAGGLAEEAVAAGHRYLRALDEEQTQAAAAVARLG